MMCNNEKCNLILEIRELIKKIDLSCYYTDKFGDFIDDLEVILDIFDKQK